jgi:hypothetical protein
LLAAFESTYDLKTADKYAAIKIPFRNVCIFSDDFFSAHHSEIS